MPRRYQQQRPRTALKRAAIWLLRLAFLLAAPELFAQSVSEEGSPYVLSERVGTVLDTEERTYFGFFPRLDGFASADVYAPTDTTVAFVISRQNRLDTSIVASREAAEVLRRYIDRYERLLDAKKMHQLERGTLIVPSLVRPSPPYRKGYNLTVTTRENEEIRGWLLYIDEETMVVSQAPDKVDRLTRPEEAVVLFPNDIRHIRLHSSIFFRLFHAVRFPFAGSADIYAAYAVPTLQKKTSFRMALSPEIRRKMEGQRARSGYSDTSLPLDRDHLQRFRKRLHLSFVYAAYSLNGKPYRSPERVGTAASVAVEEIIPPRPRLALGADYTLTKQIGIGGHVQQLEKTAIPSSNASGAPNFAWTRGYAVSSIVSYVFNPADDFAPFRTRRFPLRRVEIRAGVGPSYARFSTEVVWGMSVSGQTPSDPRRVYFFTGDAPDTHNAVGATSLLSADVFLTRWLSLGLTTHAFWFPTVRIEEQDILYTGEDQNGIRPAHVKRLESGTYRLFFASSALALRLHL